MNRRWVAVLGALVILTACRSTPESLSVTLSTSSLALAAAAQTAERVEDPLERARILATVGDGYLAGGLQADALQVADEMVRLIDDVPLSADIVPVQLAAAELLLASEEVQRARALILEVMSYLAELRDEAARANLLPLVIQTAITGDDDTRDLLPAAVDPVYIIEDTGIRAQTFIEIAQVYSGGGLAPSVTGLIQQAIPAIRSTANPLRRARLFGELSATAAAVGESNLALSLAEDAEEELLLGAADSAPDINTVRFVYRSLARVRGAEAAFQSAAAMLNPAAAGAAYVAIASGASDDPAERLALERAVEIAIGMEDAAEAGALLTAAAAEYLASGFTQQAVEFSNMAATRIWGDNPASVDVAVHRLLAETYAFIGPTDPLRQHLLRIGEPYVRGVVSVSVSEVLVETGRQGIADDFLVDALLAADDSGFLSDSLRADVVLGFARSGNYSLAIRTIERMTDPIATARAVASLALHAETNGGLSGEQLDDLRQVLQIRE